MNSPFVDPAKDVLDADPTLGNDQKADLHDAFYSKNADELVEHLKPMQGVAPGTKDALHQAKQSMTPPLDKISEAVKRIAQLDPETRTIAETSPNLLKAFTTAATAEPKGAGGASDKTSASGKGKTASEEKKASTLALAPRPDGSAHLPPIPDGHHRVLSSDGGVHDIPAERIPDAQAIDPSLHVLNP